MTPLEERALAWIEPYWNARHLVRAREWLLELDAEADEALRIAALTHDMERHFPGGPVWDPATMGPGDEEYFRAHAERSAGIVGAWLRDEGAPDGLAADVEALVRVHEAGGGPREDLLQAADSLSFLDVNPALVVRWFEEGRCTRERSKEQLAYMFDRMRVARARELGRPLLEEALGRVDAA